MQVITLWGLIVVSGKYNSTHVEFQEFYTQETCLQAASVVMNSGHTSSIIDVAKCVKK